MIYPDKVLAKSAAGQSNPILVIFIRGWGNVKGHNFPQIPGISFIFGMYTWGKYIFQIVWFWKKFGFFKGYTTPIILYPSAVTLENSALENIDLFPINGSIIKIQDSLGVEVSLCPTIENLQILMSRFQESSDILSTVSLRAQSFPAKFVQCFFLVWRL